MDTIKELVFAQNNQALTTSLKIAEVFEKEHKHVLDSIREILAAENSATKFFQESTYENRGKNYPMYFMNRDGFTLLAMGFTGEKALKFKLAYIAAFNAMEEMLKNPPAIEGKVKPAVMLADVAVVKDSLTQIFGNKIKEDMAIVEAFSQVGDYYGVDLQTQYRNLLEGVARENVGRFNPTELGLKVGVSNRKVNDALKNLGLQYKENGDWYPTDKGAVYGELVSFKRNGHEGRQLLWNENVIPVLNEYFEVA